MKNILLFIIFTVFSLNNAFATEVGITGQYSHTIPTNIPRGSDNALNIKQTQVLIQFSFFEKSPVRLYLGFGVGYGDLSMKGQLRSDEKNDSGINQACDNGSLKCSVTITEKNRFSLLAEVGPEFRFNRFFRLQTYYGVDSSFLIGKRDIPTASTSMSGLLNGHHMDNSLEYSVASKTRLLPFLKHKTTGLGVPFKKVGLRALIGLGRYIDLTVGAEYIFISGFSFTANNRDDDSKKSALRINPPHGGKFHATNLTAGLRLRF